MPQISMKSKVKEHSQQSVTHNDDSIMCGFCCIAFIVYILAGKTLLCYTNLFFPTDCKKNDIRN